MAQSVPPPQIVKMLGKSTRPRRGCPNLNVAFRICNFALRPLTLMHIEHIAMLFVAPVYQSPVMLLWNHYCTHHSFSRRLLSVRPR